MNAKKPDLLATFVERHRADFDVHEPRPDVWAAIESQLRPAAAGPLRLTPPATPPETAQSPVAAAAVTAAASPAAWWPRYGVAAGLALLVGAAGLSEAWKTQHPDARTAAPRLVAEAPAARATAAPDEALYLGPDAAAQAVNLRPGAAGDSQLTAAVRGMETYYTVQLAQRRAALLRLDTARTGTPADWQRELTSLDSSYRLLKEELFRHPQPEALLTAMNRNLQFRLDLLDQQLRRSAAAPRDAVNLGPQGYVLADSRR